MDKILVKETSSIYKYLSINWIEMIKREILLLIVDNKNAE